MKILLVPAKRDFARFIPLGIAYLAGYLEREGYLVKVYDEIPDVKPFEDVFDEFKPDVVGISCMTSAYTKAIEFAGKVRMLNEAVPIVMGGIHPTSVPEETLDSEFVDFVVIGEGEITFFELLREWQGPQNFSGIKGLAFKANGKIIVNERRLAIADLDSLPFPARHLFNMEYYAQRWNWPRGYWMKTANLMSSRGCPYSCKYCASKVMWGKTFRAYSVRRTVDEVECLVKDYGFECVSFSDDTFAIDKNRAIEIAREIKRRKLNVVFRIQLRANTCNEDLVSELAKSGCIQVDIGVESGSEKVLKMLDKKITIKQIKKAFSLLRKYKIKSGATFIIGTPGESIEDIEMSRKLAKEIDSDYVQFFIMTPYPGTPLYDYAKENNLFMNFSSFDDFRHGGNDLQPMLKVDLRPEELVRLRNELNDQFVNKAILNFLSSDIFIKDVAKSFVEDPDKFREYTKILKETGNIGEALKVVMPHKL